MQRGVPLFEGAGSKELVRRLSKRSATGGSWAPATLARVSLRLGRRTERGVQADNVRERERLGGRELMGQVRKVCSSRACKTVTPKSGGQTERVDRRGSDRLVEGQSSCSPLSGERRSPTDVQAPHTQKHTHTYGNTHIHTDGSGVRARSSRMYLRLLCWLWLWLWRIAEWCCCLLPLPPP